MWGETFLQKSFPPHPPSKNSHNCGIWGRALGGGGIDFLDGLILNPRPWQLPKVLSDSSWPYAVIPAEAGIQPFQYVLDPGFRRGDGS
jgi:hypothetical protein